MLIFVSAATGAILRCGVARYSANVFIQPFCAALVAGVIGALVLHDALTLHSAWSLNLIPAQLLANAAIASSRGAA